MSGGDRRKRGEFSRWGKGRVRRGPVPGSAELLRMAAMVSRTSDIEKALRIIAQYGIDVLGCDGSAVFLYESGERSITPMVAVSAPGQPPVVGEKISLRLSRSSAFWRSLDTDSVVVVSGNADSTEREMIDLSGVSLLALKSMSSDSGRVGVLLFQWRDGSRNNLRLTPNELNLVRALADQAAAAVIRGRLFDGLEKSEHKYRLLTENASDIVFALDGSGRFTYLNPRVKDILGYDPSELHGQYYSDIVTPESWESSQKAMRAAARSGKESFSYEWVAQPAPASPSGSAPGSLLSGPAYLDVRASFIRRGGEIVGQQGIARDVTERLKMQNEIERRGRELSISLKRQSEMKDYLALVTKVQEQERKRISRELHDDTVQALVALLRQLEILEGQRDAGPREERIHDMIALANTTLANLRRFTRDLRPPMLDDLGLEAALEWLATSSAERAGIPVEFTVSGDPRRLEPDTEVALYRIAQEGVNNSLKHASPSRVDILLAYLNDSVELVVSDDGRGFQVPAAATPGLPAGLGLLGMHERAHLLGGNLSVTSAPGHGTRLVATIPSGKA